MWIRVCAIVFMFISRLRFPIDQPISNIIRARYGNPVLQDMRKLEKLDMKYRKALLDIVFLNGCLENGVIPRFLNFKLANHRLRSSATYRICQVQLLNQELTEKHKSKDRLVKELDEVKIRIQSKVRFVDFSHICTLFLVSNDRKINRVKEVQVNKLHK